MDTNGLVWILAGVLAVGYGGVVFAIRLLGDTLPPFMTIIGGGLILAVAALLWPEKIVLELVALFALFGGPQVVAYVAAELLDQDGLR